MFGTDRRASDARGMTEVATTESEDVSGRGQGRTTRAVVGGECGLGGRGGGGYGGAREEGGVWRGWGELGTVTVTRTNRPNSHHHPTRAPPRPSPPRPPPPPTPPHRRHQRHCLRHHDHQTTHDTTAVTTAAHQHDLAMDMPRSCHRSTVPCTVRLASIEPTSWLFAGAHAPHSTSCQTSSTADVAVFFDVLLEEMGRSVEVLVGAGFDSNGRFLAAL